MLQFKKKGAKVSGTIRKGIFDPGIKNFSIFSKSLKIDLKRASFTCRLAIFNGSEYELMLGYVSALLGCCVWLILATILNLPVSGTHSIVGATVGMAIVSKGLYVIDWIKILQIGVWDASTFSI